MRAVPPSAIRRAIRRVATRLRATGALLALFAITATLAAGAAAAAGYHTDGGQLRDPNGQVIQIRGVSHFGFNAEILQPQYLWTMGWKEQIAQIKSLGFNTVRLPFVPETLYSTATVDSLSYIDPGKNPDLFGKTPLQVLDLWMAEANRQGLYILLDFHSVTKRRLYPTWFIDTPGDYSLSHNGQAYTEDHWIRDLQFVAARYASLPRFIGIDIYNEPNGNVRWSSGDANVTNPKFYWKRAAERAAAAVLQTNPALLIFVQGINGNYDGIEDSTIPMNWGESFQQQAYQPLAIPLDKLVLSPHTYGPDVFVKPTFSDRNYPNNLALDWETLFGQHHPRHPVVIGEWGGRYGQGGVGEADVVWQNALVDYLLGKGITSSFYWTYTPNSGDTGGILDDNLQVREDKMALLRRHWAGSGTPTPTATPPPVGTPAPTATPGPSPQPGSFSAQFQLGPNINAWWAEVFVEASAPLAAVHLQINGGAWTALSNTSWNSWAKSLYVAPGARVLIRATASSGSQVTSSPYTWLESVGPSPTPAPTASPLPSPPATPSPSPTPPPPVSAPYIMNFSPSSGPVGSVVTVNGWGFTGLDRAWVGEARNATLQVISDTQVRVTIPADATTGAIGLFRGEAASFTAGPFTVTAAGPAAQPPYIQSFTPRRGRVGTVVRFYGKGFTGLNNAWVGTSRQASVRVISDTEAWVTVPADASSGAIGLFNPAGVAFTASAFTVRR